MPTADRPWVVGIGELLPGGSAPPWSIPLAAAAAVPVTLFLFIEQAVAGLLLQQPAANLTKGSYDAAHFSLRTGCALWFPLNTTHHVRRRSHYCGCAVAQWLVYFAGIFTARLR